MNNAEKYKTAPDRIEAVHKREHESITPPDSDWKGICAKCKDGDIEPKHCEYYGEPNGCNSPIYGEHPTTENSSAVGNAAKMREALKYLRDASREFHHLILNSKHNEICDKYKYPEVAKISDAIANAGVVLAEPPRNCDIGTAEEQERRFRKYCDSNYNPNDVDAECWRCPLYKHRNTCEFAWGQMSYEKGEAQ